MAGKMKFQICNLSNCQFILNLIYLYIKLRSGTLFSKFGKFVTKSFLNLRKFLTVNHLRTSETQGVRGSRKKWSSRLRKRATVNESLFKKFITEIAGGREVHIKKGSYIYMRR